MVIKAEKECRYYKVCEAPICPLDDSFNYANWFADEMVCKLPRFSKEKWYKVQKALKRNSRSTGYFTVDMLNNVAQARRNLEGVTEEEGIIRYAQKSVEDWLVAYHKNHRNCLIPLAKLANKTEE